MSSPKVSVCVPVYNAESYITECLDSLVDQTLKEIEIICVDDGSTDNSPKILDGYANKYKNVKIIHQKNAGLGGARDIGLKNACGDFVGFVDADDKVDENMFETLYDLAKETNSEIAFCNLSLFPDVNAKKSIWFNPYNGEVNGEFLYRNTQPWNKIFARDLFERLGAKFGKNDSICVLLMAKARGIVSTDKKLYFYRVGHDSMSSGFKLTKFVDNTNAILKIRDIVCRDKKLKNNLGEYFDFLIINNSIQAMTVAVLHGNKIVYKNQLEILKRHDYKHNRYCKELLKPEQGSLKYFAIMNILPRNYAVSRFLINLVLGGRLK